MLYLWCPMRLLFAPLAVAFGFALQAPAQSCTGLCLQQVSCPSGQTTTITGKVFAPNGTDPLPNVTVYIPNAPVAAFPAGVQCPVTGTPPLGSPLLGTTTATDGSFLLTNVPVGANIPVVAVTGKWRRQVVVPITTACADTPLIINMPKNQIEGDIPLFAVATGSVDQVECVLRKVGISDAEFTNPGGPGRIQLFQGDGGGGVSFAGGAVIDPSTPAESTLMGNSTTLNQYDVLMLPCEGGEFLRPATQLLNLIQFANAGGRVYSSHFAYSWMFQNPPFDKVVNWAVQQRPLPDGLATVDTTFAEGQTLSAWLQIVGATTTPGQMFISTVRHNFDGVVPPTQSWLTLNDPADNNPVMQFVFDTPVGQKTGQCGRVLYNEYHVEDTGAASGLAYPAECTSTATMTPQEKLLEFSLFELTDDGGQGTLVPTTADFGSVPIGFPSAPQTFTFTNNSTFAESISILTASGDFAVAHQNCSSVPGGGSCQITVVFTPTALGARTGTLTVGAGAQTLTAALTGTGVPDLVSSVTALNFGSVDVGASVSKTIIVTSSAPSAIPFPALATTGDYAATSSCGGAVPANSTCLITITFTPTTVGTRPGTVSANSTNAAYAGLATALTGNGIDFAIAVSPISATTISGYGSVTTVTVSPLAGFSAPVTLSCTTTALASTCIPTLTSMTPTAAVSTTVTITTTSKFTVVGYGGSAGWFSLIAIASGWLLWTKRRRTSTLLRCSLFLCFLTASSILMTGCSGKLPAQNSPFTAPGTYAYTVTATDGFLTHSATYSLTLTAH